MALSLDAIFKPLNDFFLKLFQTGTESGVVFRFEQIWVGDLRAGFHRFQSRRRKVFRSRQSHSVRQR